MCNLLLYYATLLEFLVHSLDFCEDAKIRLNIASNKVDFEAFMPVLYEII